MKVKYAHALYKKGTGNEVKNVKNDPVSSSAREKKYNVGKCLSVVAMSIASANENALF